MFTRYGINRSAPIGMSHAGNLVADRAFGAHEIAICSPREASKTCTTYPMHVLSLDMLMLRTTLRSSPRISELEIWQHPPSDH